MTAWNFSVWMGEDRYQFVSALFLINTLFLLFHGLRTRITLGAFFGFAGIYGLMLWQVLQTGWWVDWATLNFNAALTGFIPILIWGALLTLFLDGLKTARAFMFLVLLTGLAAWGFALFREQLAHFLPLPYIIELGSREHLSIIGGLLVAQLCAVLLASVLRPRFGWMALPICLIAGTQIWLAIYSFWRYGLTMGLSNLHNEAPEFVLAALPAALLSVPYLALAARRHQMMPALPITDLFRINTAKHGGEDELINRDRTIGELRHLNDQLEESGRLLQYHLERARYGVIVSDSKGGIQQINSAARNLLSTQGGTLPTVLSLLSRHLPGLPELAKLAEEVTPRRCQLVNTEETDGSSRWCELSVTPLRATPQSRTEGYHLLLADVTHTVQDEQRRMVSTRLQDIHRTGRVLAHDFANIFTGTRAQLQALLQSQKEVGAIIQLNSIDTALQHAQGMLQQLGVGNQFGSPRLATVSLRKLIDDAIAICNALANSGGVKIQIRSFDDLAIEADASQIVRVLTNLIKNALRASPHGSTLSIDCLRQAHGVQISITDQGLGMTDEQISHAFEPGFSSKAAGQGGLGLAICYLMVDAHAGNLELLHNPAGSGVVARIWLPTPGAQESVNSHIPVGSKILLLRQDDAEAAEVLKQLETVQGCTVADLRSGEELQALLADEPDGWDLILHSPELSLPTLNIPLPSRELAPSKN